MGRRGLEQQLSVQVCVGGCRGVLDAAADVFLQEEMFFTAIWLRSAPHTQTHTHTPFYG